MEYKLTRKYQHSKRLKNKTLRSLVVYFLNDVLLFTQKVPFDEMAEYGINKWHYSNEYLFNGKIYQTRSDTSWDDTIMAYKTKSRDVTYPVSKKILTELKVPIDLKIQVTEK